MEKNLYQIVNSGVTLDMPSAEGSVSLAPGAERHFNSQHYQAVHSMGANGISCHKLSSCSADANFMASVSPEVNVLNYSTDFPALPKQPKSESMKENVGAWTKPPSVKSQLVTQVFYLNPDERASKNLNERFGNTNEEQQKCNEIAKATETTIELCEAKDQTLAVLITGKRVKVELARTRIMHELQTQSIREISIPKEHHRVLIGKEGAKLRQLEQETDTRIFVPSRDSTSEVIKISGTREGIEKAAQEIQLASDLQSKLAQEHLMIPKMYYPWIRGPFNEVHDRITAEHGVKINIPPVSAQSDVITITGEKEGVHRASEDIRAIYHEVAAISKSVTCQVARAQHRFVIGPQRRGIAEILKETGISVEVPPEGQGEDTIALRGDPARLGEALALVYAKASSIISAEVACQQWMHKFIIGPRGSILQNLLPNKEKIQVDFVQTGTIYLEGPPEEVAVAREALSREIRSLSEEKCSEIVKVHPTLHRHVIGRGGALISKIKEDNGVQISIPNENTNSEEIKVEGNKQGARKAIEEIMKIVKRIENEKSRDISIEQRFHRQIIGAKGESIQKLREQFPNVLFIFSDADKKSDIVKLRGDKTEVDNAYKKLVLMHKNLIENNFQMSVPVFKEFHKHIIGKDGAKIRKIREETETRIDLPCVESGEDKITVTGKKTSVEKAVDMLTKIQNELANIVVKEVIIPQKIHSRLLGGGRRLIADIQEECGGVQIRFPPQKTVSDKVSIRGPKLDVAKAEETLLALAKDREISYCEDTITAKPQFHRFLISRGGARIKKLRECYPDVRILFPREEDEDKETIHVIGKKEEISAIKKQLEVMVNELNEKVELSVDVDPQYHRHFMVRGAAVLRGIQEQHGGVTISVPKIGSGSSRMVIKGSKQCAECAKSRIEEIVEDLKARVSIPVIIPYVHHRMLFSKQGRKMSEIMSKHCVKIKFPDWKNYRPHGAVNGEDDSENSLHDVVTISGRNVNCEEAAKELLAIVPVIRTINVPFEHHRFLIGRAGETVRALMQEFEVNISIPQESAHTDEITLTGLQDNVERAIEEIMERSVQFEQAAEDRRLKSFKMEMIVPVEYHVRLIGQRGSMVRDLRNKYDVQIYFPPVDSGSDVIVISGYQANCQACKEEIENIISEAKSLFTQEVFLDTSYHPRLIGSKARNLRKVEETYDVELRFPRSTDPNLNMIVVAGKNEEAVLDCVDYLRMEEENFVMERQNRNQNLTPIPQLEPSQRRVEVEITGAPWQLDMSEDQFPSMGDARQAANVSGAWTGVRRF